MQLYRCLRGWQFVIVKVTDGRFAIKMHTGKGHSAVVTQAGCSQGLCIVRGPALQIWPEAYSAF